MAADLALWILQQCAEQLAASLAAMSEEKPETAVEEEVAADPGCLWLEQNFSGVPDARIAAGALPEAWRAIGTRVLTAAGIDDADENDIRNTFFEILTQALAGVARKFTERTGCEVNPENGRQSETDPDLPQFHRILMKFSDGSTVSIAVAFNDAIPSMLAEEASEPAAVSSAPPSIIDVDEPEPVAISPTLELLMDVELPVSVLFGRAEVQLQDVLKLNTGSIVELDRTIAEPVEIVVNNCVIARGEVVVVEGNYGVRIEEIVSRKERLRTSRRSVATRREAAPLLN